LQDLAAPVHQADVPDSAHVLVSALRAPAALAARDPQVVRLPPVKHRVRSAHRKIAPAAAASNIPRPRKAR
jgi:hypothetical protein